MISLKQAVVYGMLFASGTLIGYDSGYLNGVLGSKDFLKRYGTDNGVTQAIYLTPQTRALFTSLLVVGTLLGTAISSLISNRVGRKGSLLLAMTAYGLGVSIQVAGLPPAAFIVGRILLGAALGIISVVSPMYLIESSNSKTRGMLVSMYVLLLTCGNVLACCISLGTKKFDDSRSWRITIGFQLFLALIIFFGAIVAPESPVILLQKSKPQEARYAIANLRNINIDSLELLEAFDEMSNWVREQEMQGNVRIIECFQGPNLRRQLLGIAMSFLTIATGVTFWFGYGTTFFEAAGVNNAYMVSVILALINAIFTVPSAYLVDRVGRRRCLLWGGTVMAITQIIPAVIHTVAPNSKSDHSALISGAVIFIAAYAPTWGSVGWVTMTEPYSARLRLYQSTLTMIVYWISTWAIGFVTPYLVDATAADLGVKVCYIWFGMIIVSLVWAFLFVPELSGLSITEVDKLFEERVPAWQSHEWKKSLDATMYGVEAGVDDCGRDEGTPKNFKLVERKLSI